VAVYRASGGRIGGTYRGAPVLLLHHVGRKSGRERINVLIYLQDDTDFLIVASKGGSHKHPMWWLNLREMPETTVQIGAQKKRVAVRQISAEEKAEVWPRLVEIYPPYADYQARSSRDIPVIRLSPADRR
jgi:deazaflavin-dependent oxidoreductase (nitroreductase family)